MVWQCCKCGMHNVQCSNPLCSHYQCDGCLDSYTNLLHSDDLELGLDQSTPVASVQPGLQLSLAHPTQAVQQPQHTGNANIYPVINNGLDTFNLQTLPSHAPAQIQPQGNHYVQNNMPTAQSQPISMFIPNAATSITAPQPFGAPVQIASQTQMGYQAAGGFTVQGQTQGPSFTSYNPTGNLRVLSSRVQQPTAARVYRQNTVPGYLPYVWVPSRQNTPKPIQQPTTNAGYNQLPTGTMAPPPAPARQTNKRMNASGPAMLRGAKASVRPHPYRRENPVAAINVQRANSAPRSMNGSATSLRVVSTPARVVGPTPKVSVFTHPVHGMETLNSGVNEEQLLRNQADGIQRLTGVEISPLTIEEEIQNKIAQAMAEEMRKAGPQAMPVEAQNPAPQMVPGGIQSSVPQMVPGDIRGAAPPQMISEQIQSAVPQTAPEGINQWIPGNLPPGVLDGLYRDTRALLGLPEPATARLAPMQVLPTASQPIQGTVDYQRIAPPMSSLAFFLSGLDPERLFRGTGIRPANPGEVPTVAFVLADGGKGLRPVAAGMGNFQLGVGTGVEQENDKDDSEEEDEEEGGANIESEEEDGKEDTGEEGEDGEDEDDEDGGVPLNAHWQGNDGDADGEQHDSEGPSYLTTPTNDQFWFSQLEGLDVPFFQG